MTSSITVKRSNDYFTIASAWHEASHVICGLYNFINIYRVHLASEKNKDAETLYEEFEYEEFKSKSLVKTLLISKVQMLYAGLVGERLYYKNICGSEAFPINLRIGSHDDIAKTSKLISDYELAESGKPRFTFKKQIQNDAREVLVKHWSDVELIAHTLYKCNSLNGVEIKHLLTRKSDNKEFWTIRLRNIKLIHEDNSVDENFLKGLMAQNKTLIYS